VSTVVADNTPALNLELNVQRLGGPQLVVDYYDGAVQLAPFYAGFPWDPGAYSHLVRAVQRCFDDAARRAMVDAVQGTTERARARLESIAAGDGFFVSTGQQAGLFGGPLFTIYKTLTTIRLAEVLEAQLGVTVAPLFWIAADDHDFAEVNHAFVMGADNELHKLSVNGAGDGAVSMNRHVLDESALSALDQLAAILPSNEFSAQTLQWLRAAYAPGQTMAGAFQQLIARMFARYDLLITSSAHPIVKSLAAPVILRELEQSTEHEDLVRAQTDRLIAAGYHEQVSVRQGAANLLYEDDEGRDRLVRDAEGWHLSRSKRRFESAQLHELLTHQPERFSPNVLLRPVVASAVFPTLAYVGGPAEISYFGQIGCLFNAHEVPMPLVMPRASAEVIEHKVRKVLDKFSLEPAAFHQPIEQLASQVMRDDLPAEVSGTVTALGEQIRAAYAALVDATQSIDPTLRGPIENARNASHKALNDIEKKIVSHLKKKNEVSVEQLRKASANLYPNGEPQERALSGISYLARYGTDFLDAIAAGITFDFDQPAPQWRGPKC